MIDERPGFNPGLLLNNAIQWYILCGKLMKALLWMAYFYRHDCNSRKVTQCCVCER